MFVFKAPGVCPRCKAKAEPVGRDTVAMHVKDLSRLKAGDYHFCKTPDCPVVYFSLDNEFLHDALIREVGIKSYSSDEACICYCFSYTKGAITRDSFDERNAKVKTAGCHCALRNPSGRCCTHDFRAFVEEKFAQS